MGSAIVPDSGSSRNELNRKNGASYNPQFKDHTAHLHLYSESKVIDDTPSVPNFDLKLTLVQSSARSLTSSGCVLLI
jgi:hypothetical protein